MVGIRLADGPTLPEIALAIVDQRAIDRVSLSIDVKYALPDRVATIDRGRLEGPRLSKLPGNFWETTTLSAEIHVLIAVRILELVGKRQIVVIVKWHQDVLGAEIFPLHVVDAAYVAHEIHSNPAAPVKGYC